MPGWHRRPFRLLAFHAAGYPFVLAAAMRIGGASWPDFVIALQFILSFAAAWALYRAAMLMCLSGGLALAGVGIYMLSFPLLFDQSLLSDSLHASLFVIAVCLLVGDIRSRHTLRFTTAALAGGLLALAFLMREALQILVIALMPLLAVAAWSAGRAAWRRSALACGLVLLPLVVTVQAYEAWNVYRTGVRFVSTTAQFNMPLALEEVAARPPPSSLATRRSTARPARRSNSKMCSTICCDSTIRCSAMATWPPTSPGWPMSSISRLGGATRWPCSGCCARTSAKARRN